MTPEDEIRVTVPLAYVRWRPQYRDETYLSLPYRVTPTWIARIILSLVCVLSPVLLVSSSLCEALFGGDNKGLFRTAIEFYDNVPRAWRDCGLPRRRSNMGKWR